MEKTAHIFKHDLGGYLCEVIHFGDIELVYTYHCDSVAEARDIAKQHGAIVTHWEE